MLRADTVSMVETAWRGTTVPFVLEVGACVSMIGLLGVKVGVVKRLQRKVVLSIAALGCFLILPNGMCQEVSEAGNRTRDNLKDANVADTIVGNQTVLIASDPFQVMWQRAVEAMDESYDQWNFRPEETVDSTTFTINYIASLATDGRRRLDRVMILHADPDQDRAVTRDEALDFLQSQIGLKWISGQPLRHDDGRVLTFGDFLRADTDQDDAISEQEFVVARWDREGGDTDFSEMDKNGDRKIDLQEYSSSTGSNFRNVVEDFQSLDLNRDGLATLEELRGSVPLPRRHLVDTNLAAFDDDDDGRLSIDEYRLTMLANYNYPWEHLPEDDDLDGQISFDEFQFHPRDLFQLQKRYYFHRLDRDQDGLLSEDEFVFQRQPMHGLVRFEIGRDAGSDGGSSREIFSDKKYPRLGSPVIGRGDSEVLFHAVPRDGEHQATLFLLKSDGSETREIGHGLMPSWSPRGDRFACSRYDGGASVWILGLDGNARKRIDAGWGAEWSPDGQRIAYRNDNGIRLYDVQSGESIIWFDKHEHPYRYLQPYFAWSPDGQRLALFAQRQQSVELVVLQLPSNEEVEASSSTDFNVLLQTTEDVLGDLVWTRDGRLLFSMFSRDLGRRVIYQVSVGTNQKPRVLEETLSVQGVVELDVAQGGEFWILNRAE